MFKYLGTALVVLPAIHCQMRYGTSGPRGSGVSHVKMVRMRSTLNPLTGQNEVTETVREVVEDLQTGRTVYNEDTHIVPQPSKANPLSRGETSNVSQPVVLEIRAEMPDAIGARAVRDDSDGFVLSDLEPIIDTMEADPRGRVVTWAISDSRKHNVSGNSALGLISVTSALATLLALVIL